MLIDSPQNPQVKFARTLQTSKGRKEHKLFFAEGPAVVAEALMYSPGIEWIAWCPELANDDVTDLAGAAVESEITVFEMSNRAFTAMSDTRSPQGIAAVIHQPYLRLSDIMLPLGACRILVLHDMRDPGNVGTMIRSADALGATAVVLTAHCADPYEPKVVRATAGSLFHLPVVEIMWAELEVWAKTNDFALVTSCPTAKYELGDAKLPERALVIVGNEAHGLPEDILQQSDLMVKIPMRGKAESLNASTAAAIILYEYLRMAE